MFGLSGRDVSWAGLEIFGLSIHIDGFGGIG